MAVALQALVNCCGAEIIYGMSDAGDTTLRETIEKVQGANLEGNGRAYGGNRMVFCVMNDAQCANKKLLDVLAGLGFVFAGRSNNGLHNSWINLFVRGESKGVSYKAPPFVYPGVCTIPEEMKSHPPVMNRVPKKPDALPNPFKKDGGVEWAYVAEVEKA